MRTGPPRHPGRDRQQRLHRHVELAAEAAAAGGGADAHARAVDAEHARGLLAVHVGRLRAGRRPRCDRARRRRAPRSRPPARYRRARRSAVSNVPSAVAAARHARPPDVAALRLPRVSTLSGRAAWIAGAPAASAARCRDSGAAASRRSAGRHPRCSRPPRASPTSASTASPRKRTTPGASTGWSFMLREDAEGVLARHVLGGEDRHEPRGARLDALRGRRA